MHVAKLSFAKKPTRTTREDDVVDSEEDECCVACEEESCCVIALVENRGMVSCRFGVDFLSQNGYRTGSGSRVVMLTMIRNMKMLIKK